MLHIFIVSFFHTRMMKAVPHPAVWCIRSFLGWWVCDMKGLRKSKATTQHGTRMEVTSQKCDLFLVVKSGEGYKGVGGGGGTNWFEENYMIICVATAADERRLQKSYRFRGTLWCWSNSGLFGEVNLKWLLVFMTCVAWPAWFHKWCLNKFVVFFFYCQREFCRKMILLGSNLPLI